MKIRKSFIVTAVLASSVALVMCTKPGIFNDQEYDPRLSGGLATVFDETSQAFTHDVDGLSDRDQHVHELGDSRFEGTFVTAPAPVNSGLGPIFNNVSCISCHHNDGKGTPSFGTVNSSMLMRLSMKDATDAHGGDVPIPGFGLQLQDEAIFGVKPEAKVNLNYTENNFTFPDGEIVSLRTPVYQITDPYLSLPADYLTSPRMAPSVFWARIIS